MPTNDPTPGELADRLESALPEIFVLGQDNLNVAIRQAAALLRSMPTWQPISEYEPEMDQVLLFIPESWRGPTNRDQYSATMAYDRPSNWSNRRPTHFLAPEAPR